MEGNKSMVTSEEVLEMFRQHSEMLKTVNGKKKYMTVSEPDPKPLDETVNKYLNEGWELYGTPYAYRSSTGYSYFCQALFKIIVDESVNKS